MGMHIMPFAWLFVCLGGLLFLALVAVAVYLVVRASRSTKPAAGEARPNTRQILDERLARGEITAEEYDALRAKLEQ